MMYHKYEINSKKYFFTFIVAYFICIFNLNL